MNYVDDLGPDEIEKIACSAVDEAHVKDLAREFHISTDDVHSICRSYSYMRE